MKKTLKESHNNFQPAAPAVVSGNLEPIGKRDPNKIPPKFAMLLKDTSENGDSCLRLLVTYANGESLVIPSPAEDGCFEASELLLKVLECLGGEEETVRVISAALERAEIVQAQQSLEEHFLAMGDTQNVWQNPKSKAFVSYDNKKKEFRVYFDGGKILKTFKKKDDAVKYSHTLKESVLKEESITDRYQKMINALEVLKLGPNQQPNSPANMTKLEAIGVLRDMGLPDEKAQATLLAVGYTMDEVDDLLNLARQGIK